MKRILLVMLFISCFARAESLIKYDIEKFTGANDSYGTVQNPDYKEDMPQYLRSWDVLMRPEFGFIGTITIDDETAINATVVLKTYNIFVKKFYPPVENPVKYSWFERTGIYNRDSSNSKIVYEHYYKVDKVPFKIPIVLPQKRLLSSSILEVYAEGGQCLSSITIGDLYKAENAYDYGMYSYQPYGEGKLSVSFLKSGNKVWIPRANTNALNSLEEIFDGKVDTQKMSEFPGNLTALLSADSIWLDKTNPMSVDVMQKYILSGGRIFGSDDVIADYLKELNLKEGFILNGGIISLATLDKNKNDLFGKENRYNSYSRNRFSREQNYYELKLEDGEENFFDRKKPLFSHIKKSFVGFAFITSLVYGIASLIFLPILFLKTKGDKRITLWWKIPLMTLVYTVVSAIVALVFVNPKHSLCDVTELRMGYGDWPITFCLIEADAMKFGKKAVGWQFPVDIEISSMKGHFNQVVETTDYSTGIASIEYLNGVRGGIDKTSFYTFRDINQPFTASISNKIVSVTSDKNLRNVYVRKSYRKWIKLGAIKKGQTVTFNNLSRTVKLEHGSKFLSDIDTTESFSLAEKPKEAEVCKNCHKVHEKSSDKICTYYNSVIILAVDDADDVGIKALDDKAISTSRIGWVCQVPLEDLDKKGGK